MMGLFTAEQARATRLMPTQNIDTELGRVLSKIEEECYLKTGIYWGYPLQEETIAKLRSLHYVVRDVSVMDRQAYTIEWN